MRRIFSLTVLVCLLLTFALAAYADDKQPPPWQRGAPRTTFQQWEFATNANPAVLEPSWDNVNGAPRLDITPAPGKDWLDLYDNRQGVWPLSGDIQIVIPNFPDHPDWTKIIWLQLTWQKQGTLAPIVLADCLEGRIIEEDQMGNWFHTTWMFALPYNPPFETIGISGNIWVDEVVIDTACVPEPSSLLALATCVTGLAGLTWKKRS